MNSKKAINSNTQQTRIISFSMLALAISVVVTAHAATPDAGTILRDLAPTAQQPTANSVLSIQAPAMSQDASGGIVITVQQSIRFTGNTLYSSAILSSVLADAAGEAYDLAGLQGLANRITAYYRSQGFAFARALLPVQPLGAGALIIEIIEGRYGSIVTTGDPESAGNAQVFLSDLHSGDVIYSPSLERSALILADQPGFKTTPLLRPGQVGTGTGDLIVNVERDNGSSSELNFDNYGNRYTGSSRFHLDFNINSPFLFGDQIKLNTLYSEENMWMGAFNYSLPIGGSGLRANTGYALTSYELGKEFASSLSYGTTEVTSAGLSYPVIRSQRANLALAATFQHKKLNDSDDITPSDNTKLSDSLPISVNFDRSDKSGGGITYGAFSWTNGSLTVATANSATDSATAKTAGAFSKINLDIARLQKLSTNFTLFSRVSAQWADKNLDSSEKFGLGGANGVRAYPIGEAYGDDGSLVQLEIRYAISNSIFYVFYDTGTITINHTAFAAGTNERSLAGNGLGFRFDTTYWSVDVSTAWATTGTFSDVNQADTPTVWTSVKYKF
jgi:hemolysin activation/secretion protein